MEKVSAVIPVKGNSSRVPGKNILPFADSNLLVNKIRQLQSAEGVCEILVSSDSDIMLEMAVNEGARAEKRPADLADESRPFGDLVEHVCGLMKYGHLMWAPVTSPCLDGKFYANTVMAYFEGLNNDYDSLTTVLPFNHFIMDEKGPYNFNPDKAVTNSQDLPKWHLWTCGCSIISKKLALQKRYIFGAKPYRVIITPYQAIDIDTQYDYELAKAMWKIYNDK
jgi:N-acylneuraminate cytidylyltransferase